MLRVGGSPTREGPGYATGDYVISPGRLPYQATLPDLATYCRFGQCEIQNNPTMHYDNSNNTFLVFHLSVKFKEFLKFGDLLYNGNTSYHFLKWNEVLYIFKTKELRKQVKFNCCLKTFPPGQYFFSLLKVVKILYQMNVQKENIPL